MQGRTYRFFAGKPLYPFGYGLSYSDFHYSGLSVKNGGSSSYDVSATVRNDGKFEGDEVAQMYLNNEKGANPALRGFKRVHLRPGETAELHFTVPQADTQHKTHVSVGGGLPMEEWTQGRFVTQALSLSSR